MSFSYPQATPVKIAKISFPFVAFSVAGQKGFFLAVIKYLSSNPLQVRVWEWLWPFER